MFALGFLLYVNTLGHDFALDDYVVFRDNSYVKEGVAGIGKIMSQDTFRGFLEKEVALSGGRYRPLSLVTFALEQQLWGGPAEEPTFRPERSHGINALLYAITCLALYACLLKLLHALPNRGWIAWLAAMLFAAHPSHTEAVANIKGRDDVLCFLLVLVSFWMLLQATDRAKAWLAGSVAVYFLALFSKESAVTFLAIFPACLYCLRGFRVSQLLKWTAPFLAVAIVFVLIRAVCAGSIGDRVSTDVMLDPFAAMTSTERYATIFLTLFRYLKLMVFPHPLSYDYSYNQIPAVDFLNVEALLSVVFTSGAGGLGDMGVGAQTGARDFAAVLSGNALDRIQSGVSDWGADGGSLFVHAVSGILRRDRRLGRGGPAPSGRTTQGFLCRCWVAGRRLLSENCGAKPCVEK